MSDPIRIQRKRSKGWKMPANTVYVGRPTKWGNMFTLHDGSAVQVVQKYRREIEGRVWTEPNIRTIKAELRGKDLACWCPLTDKDGKPVPCHADILLEIANERRAVPPEPGSTR